MPIRYTSVYLIGIPIICYQILLSGDISAPKFQKKWKGILCHFQVKFWCKYIVDKKMLFMHQPKPKGYPYLSTKP